MRTPSVAPRTPPVRKAAVCFTCSRDAVTVRIAVDSLRTHHPDIPVYLSLENKDTQFPCEAFSDCVIVRQECERRGLSGRPHMEYQLQLFYGVVLETGAERLIKFDSDVAFPHDLFARWPALDLVGVGDDGRPGLGIFGAAYIISAEAVARVCLAYADEEAWNVLSLGTDYYPEDITMWRMHMRTGGSCERLPSDRLAWLSYDSAATSPRSDLAVLRHWNGFQRHLGQKAGRAPTKNEVEDRRAGLLVTYLTLARQT